MINYCNAYILSKIHNIFNNENCPSLLGLPKIFVYDCCRGSDVQDSIIIKQDSIEINTRDHKAMFQSIQL